jgi:FtsH-binding integral membrane protein
MFARPRKFLRNAMGNVLYWIGCGLAVLVITQAIILSLAFGNPLVPLLVGALGTFVWFIATELKYILTDKS